MVHSTMMDDYPLTLGHIFDRADRFFSTREIVSHMPDKSLHRYTYRDFSMRSLQLAAALNEMGLKKGETVGTLMWNHYAHLEAYYGIPLAGGVVHTLNLRLHPDEIAYLSNHAQNRFLIVDDTLLPLLAKFVGQLKVEKIICVRLTQNPLQPNMLDYEHVLSTAPPDWRRPQLEERDACGMCYTSGTTGKPKGVVYSHRAICLHAMMLGIGTLDSRVVIKHGDTVLPVVPMFHANAWGIPHVGIMAGAKLVMPGPYMDPANLLMLFEKENVSVSVGVPTIWLGMLKELKEKPDHYKIPKGMRTLVGGSAVPEALIRGFEAYGVFVVQGWGMTETTPLGTTSLLTRDMQEWDEDRQFEARAMQGMPVPFVEARILNSQGQEVAWDGKSIGELQVRGPWVAASYYDPEEDSADKWTESGWFRTGDVACMTPEGFVRITDRTKDLIKSGGEWISSIDLENAMMAHPDVQEACVIAVPHPKWAERPLAVVVPKPGRSVDLTAMRSFLAPKFAKFWLPDGLVEIDQIPRSSAGKFMKSVLRDRYQDWDWTHSAEDENES